MTIREYLKESSLSRVYRQMLKHDSGTITAFRYARDCGDGEKYTKKENMQRNKALLAKLQSLRYGVTSVKGKYIENYGSADAREVGENVFLVVDINDKGTLEKDLRKLGEEFDQDSILFIPQGAEEGRLIGTNHCENGYPGYGKIVKLKNPVFGVKGEFFTSIKGRPFILKESAVGHKLPQGYMGRMACHTIAKRDWSEFDVE